MCQSLCIYYIYISYLPKVMYFYTILLKSSKMNTFSRINVTIIIKYKITPAVLPKKFVVTHKEIDS